MHNASTSLEKQFNEQHGEIKQKFKQPGNGFLGSDFGLQVSTQLQKQLTVQLLHSCFYF